MLGLTATSDLSALSAKIDKLAAGQIPFATSLAINRIAELSLPALRSNMSVVFDRPKPFTLNSLRIKRSTKSNLAAVVFHTPVISRYLESEIEGGTRSDKAFELRLGGEILVPAPGIKLDAYGGVSRATIRKIVEAYAKPNGKDANGIFVIKPGAKSHLKPGVYQRVPNRVTGGKRGRALSGGGTRLVCLMLYKTSARYEKRYDMIGVVSRVIDAEFSRQFAASMDYALSTARINI